MILRNPQLLWLLLTLPAFVLFWRWHGVRVPATALGLRLLTVTLLILALADPLIGTAPPPEGALVVLVDQSDSLSEGARAALRTRAAELARSAGSGVKVLYFGANVVSAGEQEGAAPAALDPGGSDLAAGLRAARALLPGGGQVILVSDGLATSPDTLAEARLAARAGVRVDVAHVAPAEAPEVAITAVRVPRALRLGEAYPIEINVRSTGGPVSGRLRLWGGEGLLGDEEGGLTPGEEGFSFSHTAGSVGVVRLRAELEASAGDTFGANNRAAAVAQVNPPPQVLLVATSDDEAALLGDALRRQGVETRRVRPAEMPSRLVDLAAYDGVVLVDVPAAALSLDQMASVRELVRSEGRGLVAIGGRNSSTLGAYKATPLEETLPVTMEPPPRPQRTEIALLLIVDRSASMTASVGVSKFDMAKEAAILATESLKPEDRIGVLAFDTGQLWV
ncbi:MAG: VWA domain-containing protein, partial [Chloroflexaceae bacterium]|nr:VWA domain-containing protein [Chloroflexaceae bacterium]